MRPNPVQGHLYCFPFHTQLEAKPSRPPLTMGNQKSEMRAQYGSQRDMISRVLPSNDPQPPTLADHFSEGPTKVSIAVSGDTHTCTLVLSLCPSPPPSLPPSLPLSLSPSLSPSLPPFPPPSLLPPLSPGSGCLHH